MVSTWAADNELVLGQIKTDEKSNEITAIPELLRLLALEGCIVTIDAMGCQPEVGASRRKRSPRPSRSKARSMCWRLKAIKAP